LWQKLPSANLNAVSSWLLRWRLAPSPLPDEPFSVLAMLLAQRLGKSFPLKDMLHVALKGMLQLLRGDGFGIHGLS
jgi:hypothetical protein